MQTHRPRTWMLAYSVALCLVCQTAFATLAIGSTVDRLKAPRKLLLPVAEGNDEGFLDRDTSSQRRLSSSGDGGVDMRQFESLRLSSRVGKLSNRIGVYQTRSSSGGSAVTSVSGSAAVLAGPLDVPSEDDDEPETTTATTYVAGPGSASVIVTSGSTLTPSTEDEADDDAGADYRTEGADTEDYLDPNSDSTDDVIEDTDGTEAPLGASTAVSTYGSATVTTTGAGPAEGPAEDEEEVLPGDVVRIAEDGGVELGEDFGEHSVPADDEEDERDAEERVEDFPEDEEDDEGNTVPDRPALGEIVQRGGVEVALPVVPTVPLLHDSPTDEADEGEDDTEASEPEESSVAVQGRLVGLGGDGLEGTGPVVSSDLLPGGLEDGNEVDNDDEVDGDDEPSELPGTGGDDTGEPGGDEDDPASGSTYGAEADAEHAAMEAQYQARLETGTLIGMDQMGDGADDTDDDGGEDALLDEEDAEETA